MSVRVSPYLLSLIDWANPYTDPLRTAVHPGGVAPLARSSEARPRLAARARRHAGRGAHAPLRRQGALPGARHLPRLLPLLHAQLRRRHRHRGGREVPPQGQRRALAAGLRVHRVAHRARGHRHLRRRRLPAARRADHGDRRGAAGHPERPAHALRHQGSGGHAAEDPHRRGVDRRAHRASSSTGASCTRRSCSTRTSTTRTRSPASPKPR